MKELLGIDTINYGRCYFPPDSILCIGKKSDTITNVAIEMTNGNGLDLEVEGDVDEVAQMLETCCPSISLHMAK